MDLKDELVQIEKQMDDKMDKLKIWEHPFQSIISTLLYTIENVDINNRRDTAIDFASRLSYVFNNIKNKAASSPVLSTTEALSLMSTKESVNDIKFIISYSHLCQLMPQIRKEILIVTNIEGKKVQLEYASTNVKKAEIIDRLYSYLSLQIIIPFIDKKKIEEHVYKKVEYSKNSIGAEDFILIKEIYNHYYNYYILIKPLPNDIFEKMTGVTYNDYHSFCASVCAFADFFINLGRAYFKKIDKKRNNELDNYFASEYQEWSVCCLNYKTLGWIAKISDLDMIKFKNILRYFLQIYSDDTGEDFKQKSYCGEGFFPPFLLLMKSIIFSPHAIRSMLPINNILYSVNKLDKNYFDDEISNNLEPSLICQIEYIFSCLPNLKVEKNINYTGSEIDLIIFSENENVVICIQAKSTIAPDSARSVERVSDRVLEGYEQIKQFDELDKKEKQDIINKAFNKNLMGTKIINILVVRSCAGSVNAWETNSKYKIINYSLLAWLIASKIEKKITGIIDFENEIKSAQDILLEKGATEEVYETLKICDYDIVFPNLIANMKNLFHMNFKSFKYLPDFEDIKSL